MKFFKSILFWLFTLPVLGQQYNFINYGVADGLAQSQVTDICQDNLGNLWIGTMSGLSRFDSKTFVNYSIDDGLADNIISNVIVNKKGELWVVTPRGVSRFENGHFISYFFSETQKIKDIIEYKGQLFLATSQEIKSFNGSSFKTVFKNSETDLIFRALGVVSDTALLCGTNKGLYQLSENRLEKFPLSDLDDLNISDVKVDGDRLVLATYNTLSVTTGIRVYNLRTNSIVRYYWVKGIPVRSLYVDAVSIWAASNFGIIEIRNGRETYFTENNGLTINSIKTIMKDMEGNLWIGTFGKGLLKFSGNAIVSYSTNEGLSSDIVMSINQFSNGDFTFGTYDKGLNLYENDGDFELINKQSGLYHNSVWATFIDNEDYCWVGTGGGLQCIHDGEIVKKSVTNKIRKKVRSICQHPDSTMFFAGSHGLWIKKRDSIHHLLTDEKYNLNKVEVTESSVFLASRNGLYWQRYDKINEPFKKIALPEENINTICVDQFDNVWVGSLNGLFIISPNLDIKTLELDKANFQSKTIMGIIRDHEDRMWVSTTHGLYMVSGTDPFKRLSFFYQYTLSEGLADMESNLNALFEDKDGYIWLGTSSELVRINPELNPVLFSYSLPKLSVTGIRLFKEDFNYDSYSTGEFLPSGIPESLKLPYTKNHLTFDFIGINNKNPDNVYYTYRLLGAEEKWSSITKENSASYSFISPGVYEFQVKSANKNLEWTEPVVIEIEITPPYWQQWWFVLLVAIAVFTLSYYILSVRISGIKQKKDNERLVSENKLRNLEQQSLNASMNRHFIFNSLNSIQYFINSSDKKSANKYLSNFAQLIRKNLDSSTQPNFLVTLNEEIERINLYLTLEKMRFNEKFDYNITLDEEIDTEMIQVPSMILQPFVENSIIHGVLPKNELGHIAIAIKEENDFIVFEVVDDGVGIDSSLSQKDNFEGDHKSQGMEITANRIDLLRSINGDKLMIIGPFQINKNGKAVGTKVIIKLPVY